MSLSHAPSQLTTPALPSTPLMQSNFFPIISIAARTKLSLDVLKSDASIAHAIEVFIFANQELLGFWKTNKQFWFNSEQFSKMCAELLGSTRIKKARTFFGYLGMKVFTKGIHADYCCGIEDNQDRFVQPTDISIVKRIMTTQRRTPAEFNSKAPEQESQLILHSEALRDAPRTHFITLLLSAIEAHNSANFTQTLPQTQNIPVTYMQTLNNLAMFPHTQNNPATSLQTQNIPTMVPQTQNIPATSMQTQNSPAMFSHTQNNPATLPQNIPATFQNIPAMFPLTSPFQQVQQTQGPQSLTQPHIPPELSWRPSDLSPPILHYTVHETPPSRHFHFTTHDWKRYPKYHFDTENETRYISIANFMEVFCIYKCYVFKPFFYAYVLQIVYSAPIAIRDHILQLNQFISVDESKSLLEYLHESHLGGSLKEKYAKFHMPYFECPQGSTLVSALASCLRVSIKDESGLARVINTFFDLLKTTTAVKNIIANLHSVTIRNITDSMWRDLAMVTNNLDAVVFPLPPAIPFVSYVYPITSAEPLYSKMRAVVLTFPHDGDDIDVKFENYSIRNKKIGTGASVFKLQRQYSTLFFVQTDYTQNQFKVYIPENGAKREVDMRNITCQFSTPFLPAVQSQEGNISNYFVVTGNHLFKHCIQVEVNDKQCDGKLFTFEVLSSEMLLLQYPANEIISKVVVRSTLVLPDEQPQMKSTWRGNCGIKGGKTDSTRLCNIIPCNLDTPHLWEMAADSIEITNPATRKFVIEDIQVDTNSGWAIAKEIAQQEEAESGNVTEQAKRRRELPGGITSR